jgi:hypothetical protein
MLPDIDWETAVSGLQTWKPKYGIVVHKVDKHHFDCLIHDADKDSIKHVEKTNTLPIIDIVPLLRKDTGSIIIFTSDPPHDPTISTLLLRHRGVAVRFLEEGRI